MRLNNWGGKKLAEVMGGNLVAPLWTVSRWQKNPGLWMKYHIQEHIPAPQVPGNYIPNVSEFPLYCRLWEAAHQSSTWRTREGRSSPQIQRAHCGPHLITLPAKFNALPSTGCQLVLVVPSPVNFICINSGRSFDQLCRVNIID